MAGKSIYPPITIGDTFGRLTVLSEAPRTWDSRRQWRCLCSCGTQLIVVAMSLKKGTTQSCGCLRIDDVRQRFTKHGAANKGKKLPEYCIWLGIKKRIFNSHDLSYTNYGGRGITMCLGWKDSFSTFFADTKARPSPKHTIERRDNNGHYSCGHCTECIANGWSANCYYATRQEQSVNKRNNRFLTYKGQTKTLSQWSQELGMGYSVITRRLRKNWPPEQIFTVPIQRR